MKNINKSLIAICLGLASFTACKKDTPTYEELNGTRDQAWLNVQKATNGIQNLSLFPVVNERKDVFSVNYGGLGLPDQDISVTFVEDKGAIDSLNKIRQNNGQKLLTAFPAGSYSLDKTNTTIKSGQTGSEYLTLTYDPSKFDLTKEYMLALKATNDQGYTFRPGKSTILYYAAVVEKPHVKTGWSAKTDSQMTTGEGEGNGVPSSLIDGNIASFWHSMYSPDNLPFPHWAEVDFGKEIYVTQIGLTRRQNNSNGFKTFDVQGSKDGTTWVTLIKDAVMERTELDMQKFPITPQYLKKIKVTMKDNFNGQASTHLAEIDAIGY